MLDGKIGELLSIFEVIFQEVEEGNVIRGHGHHDLVLFLKGLEVFNGLLNFLVLDEMNSFSDFHLALHLRQICGFKVLDHRIVASQDVLLQERSYQLGSR